MAAFVAGGQSVDATAAWFGVSANTVFGALRENNVSAPVRPPTTNEKKQMRNKGIVAALEAGQSALDVSVAFDLSVHSVYSIAHKSGVRLTGRSQNGHRLAMVNMARAVVTRDEWGKADWNLRDVDLANNFGICRERVRQMRNLLSKPASPSKHLVQGTVAAIRWLRENREAANGLMLKDIVALFPFPVTEGCVKGALGRLGMQAAHLGKAIDRLTKENLASFVDISPGGCWLWKGQINSVTGYGMLSQVYAHQAVFKMFKGEVPDGKWVLHNCGGNPSCVNPDHMYAGTSAESTEKRFDNGRANLRKLTPDDVAEIHRLRQLHGWGLPKIAEKVGVSIGHVVSILNGRAWKSVDPDEALTQASVA